MNLIKTIKLSIILLVFFAFVYPKYYVFEDNQDTLRELVGSRDKYSGITSYVINLDRSKERYEHVKTNIYNLGLSCA